tara:strand:- start:73 stop:333 length:261 start_codon:yes stop_codon:yes gene_type:complete
MVIEFTDISTGNVTGYNKIYVYAKSYSDATELLRKQFPFVINEYNYDEETGEDQYSWQKLEKIYPHMYARPNYLIINNPHQTRKKK